MRTHASIIKRLSDPQTSPSPMFGSSSLTQTKNIWHGRSKLFLRAPKARGSNPLGCDVGSRVSVLLTSIENVDL